jgi:hypothetical protein
MRCSVRNHSAHSQAFVLRHAWCAAQPGSLAQAIAAEAQCGRAVYTDIHVSNGAQGGGRSSLAKWPAHGLAFATPFRTHHRPASDLGYTLWAVKDDQYDDADVLGAVMRSGARALIIGRKALVILGLPVLTNDYDLWIHIDDIALLNASLLPLEHYPTKTPDEARATGRYVLENGERIDVLVARHASTKDESVRLDFDDAWSRRQAIAITSDLTVFLPSIPDLITTKKWSARQKDIGDIQLLQTLLVTG